SAQDRRKRGIVRPRRRSALSLRDVVMARSRFLTPDRVVSELSEQCTANEKAEAGRGWHGMSLRNQKHYDWRMYNALVGRGCEDIRQVEVVRGSPAWLAGLRSGFWIVKINGSSFEDLERQNAPIGARSVIEAFTSRGEPFRAVVTLKA